MTKMLCFRQGKYAIEGEALAPIGGYLEPGEEPLIAAQRELLEETGYEASDWIDLGHYRVDTNRGAGTAYFFMAHHAHPIAARDADDLEDQELLLLTRAEVEARFAARRIQSVAVDGDHRVGAAADVTTRRRA